MLKTFQLLGDSNMLRFAASRATFNQPQSNLFRKELGLCVSGQTVQGLVLQLETTPLICKNVVVLIGTNDVLNIRHCETTFKVTSVLQL